MVDNYYFLTSNNMDENITAPVADKEEETPSEEGKVEKVADDGTNEEDE